MTKRTCPFTENEPYIKKQTITLDKSRGIPSLLSEKTLQLLYKGSSKQFLPINGDEKSLIMCFQCSTIKDVQTKCNYCDKKLCLNCANTCTACDEVFCKNCSFPNYTDNSSMCYSCY